MIDEPVDNRTVAGVEDYTLITQFGAYQSQRGFSRRTIVRRRGSLTSLLRWIQPGRFATVTIAGIEEWLGSLPSARTRHAYRSDARVFWKWATRRGLLPNSPMDDIDPIRLPRLLPRPVPASMVPMLIDTAPSDRVRVAVGLAAYAGLRRSEIVALHSDDIQLWTKPATLAVRHGKGARDRIIPVARPLADLLVGRRGRIVAVCADTISGEVTAHLRASGIDATCHQLRHTFGTEIVRHSNLLIGAALLGHESVRTTQGYAAWSQTDAALAVEAIYSDRHE